MIEFFKTTQGVTTEVSEPVAGCWINVVSPTDDDKRWLRDDLGISPDLLSSALDDDERSHTDYDDDTNQTLVIADCPFVEDAKEAEDTSITQYDTHPLSFVFLPEKDMLVTISLRENRAIITYTRERLRKVNTHQHTRLFLLIMLYISHSYIFYLRNIERQFNANEKVLRETLRDEELIKMLGFEKSLVYFSTSLKSTESTLVRVSSGRVVKLYEDDRDLIDDVLIEIRQAIETCSIHTRVLNGIMDTFGSVISNNVNETMRRLTIITLIFAIPTIVFSFYGMNVSWLPGEFSWIIPTIVAIVGCFAGWGFLSKSRMFK